MTVGIAGCAPHTWVAGPNVTAADFVPARARCSIMARHGGDAVDAAGPLKFVVAEQVANAIGNAFQASADFNDCMQASGFLIADGQTPPPAQGTAYSTKALLPQNAMSVSSALLAAPSPAPSAAATIRSGGRDPLVVPPATPTGDVTYTWAAPTTE